MLGCAMLPGSQPSIRADLSSQACDICRKRKSKCKISPRSAHIRCGRCERLDLSCTFVLPSKTRGPKRRYGSPKDLNRGKNMFSCLSRSSVGVRSQMQHNPTVSYRTDSICDRVLFKSIMQDYLDYIYPMVPVVHRPSFRKALREDQDSENDSCFALMVSIAALVVATMPSRFQAYQSEILSSRFSSRKEFVHFCYAKCVGMRTSSYFDELGFQKFAVSYVFFAAFLQLGDYNWSRMLSVEAMQIARLLNLHRISEYEGLNLIETQLRKKGFWLMFYSFVHAHLQNLLGERLTYLDPTLLCSINPEDLMPLDVEDEFIFEYEVLTPTSNKPCLVTGFILHSRVFWAAIRSLRPDPTMDEPCPCVRAKNPDMEVVYYQNRFHGLKSVIENIPPSLQQAWTPNDEEINSGDTSDAEGSMSPLQFSSIRANLHVTHLWLQSLILDQLDAAQSHRQRQFAAGGLDQETADLDQRALWMERENICRQLFFILFNFPPLSLDANGLHLVNKVRDITASLLACPFHPADPLSKQAAQYIQHSTEILSRLDRSEGMNTMHLQTWVDTDRLWR